jgi:hypothetical protein
MEPKYALFFISILFDMRLLFYMLIKYFFNKYIF